MKIVAVNILVLAFSLFCQTLSAQTIVVKRTSTSKECVTGSLYVNKKFICHSLEFVENMLPAGTYDAFMKTDGIRGWGIKLAKVPLVELKTYEVYIGNYIPQTSGCTLVGKKAMLPGCTLIDSAKALKKLEKALINIRQDFLLATGTSEDFPITLKYE